MDLSKVTLHLNQLFPESNFVLLEVRAYYEYTDGRKSDNLLGYRYHIVEDANFEHFDVKVPGTTQTFTQEQIDASKTRIYVSFEDDVARFYRTPDGRTEITVSAKSISQKRQSVTA